MPTDTTTFEQWIGIFAPTLIFDSYSFKSDLLSRMSLAYDLGGPAAAVAAARPYPNTYRKLKARFDQA